MIAKVAAVVAEDYSGHGDGDGREPGDVLLPLHADGMPAAGGRARHEQALRKCGETCGARRRDGPVPGVDDVSAREHCEPREHRHHGEVDAEEFLVLEFNCWLERGAVAAIQLDERAGAGEEIERAEAHSMNECEETARGEFH